ncbi:MAG TPA: P-II family nitrogen regulator [Thermoanaerobaculia bacterium]|jgi:nitrogen regulatory protein P-II 1|nr:P-II family nitrogen regulator [Thermoanaerobaculia bacterium]
MLYLVAMIPPDRYDAVVDALSARHVRGLTVSEAMGFGQEHDTAHPEHREHLGVELTRKLRFELVCRDDELEGILAAFYEAAHSGRRGDGKVFVLPVQDALRIKTGQRGEEAL